MVLLVKSGQEPATLVSAIRGIVASIDKEQPIFRIATMQEVVNASVFHAAHLRSSCSGCSARWRSFWQASESYGVISYSSAAQRSREIGIRVALGAQRGDVMRLVLAQGGKISAAGIVIGSAASLGLTRLMAKLLYSVSVVDPATFAVVAWQVALIGARRRLGDSGAAGFAGGSVGGAGMSEAEVRAAF